MDIKTILKKTPKKIQLAIIVGLAGVSFIGGDMYFDNKKVEAQSEYETTVSKYKNEVKKIMFNGTNQSTLNNISSEFEHLSENKYLSKTSKTEAENYMNFTKYLSYREDLYTKLMELATKSASLKNPAPNKFKSIVDTINSDLTVMKDLYNDSLFIRDYVIVSPQAFHQFVIRFSQNLSSKTKQELIDEIDDYFNKTVPLTTDFNEKFNAAKIKTLPKITPEELNQDYMKNLKTYSSFYKEKVTKLDELFKEKNINENSDSSLLNEYFTSWNGLLNEVWSKLQENLPNAKLKEAEYPQLLWIQSKNDKSKFEQAQMTKTRTLEVLNNYIYQTNSQQ
ncbi:MAG: hypothetical protein ACRDAU_02535 [Clostridium sp.]